MLKFYTWKVGRKVNLRLNKLATMVDQDARIADIGTDHAYLPIELVKSGKVNFAIASDIGKGPLDNAKQDIKEAGLEGKIETRLGAGLETISAKDNIDTVVIAGMGGNLMSQILNDALVNKKMSFDTLILEPNVGEYGVRKWLMQHSYQIVDEQIVAEAGHIYELIKAKKTESNIPLTEKELYFGPILIKTKNQTFTNKWIGQLKYQQNLLVNLNKAKNKDMSHIKQVQEQIEMIKGELND